MKTSGFDLRVQTVHDRLGNGFKHCENRMQRIRKTVWVVVGLWCAPALAQAPPDPVALWEQATVYRDAWGVPHVYADNPYALAFAFGYAQAEDHLEPMLLAYRVANGTAAAALGERFVESDVFSVKMCHASLAVVAFDEAAPLTRALCEGFAVGVNTWMVEHPGKTPEWAEGVRPADVLALWHCYVMSFAPFDLEGTWRRAPAANSGNAWALGPARSTSGRPILVMNPHTDYDGPFQWYEAHLATGPLDVAGATLYGLPVIVQGHNGTLGWALSPNAPDFADMYADAERTQPTKKKDAVTEAMRLDYLRAQVAANTQTVFVRTAAGFEQHPVPALLTDNGPVMGMHQGRPCVLRAGGYHDFGGLEQLFEMGCAQSLPEFQQVLTMHQIPCFHVVYADRDGNIFYLYNAKMGERPAAVPTEPNPGSLVDALTGGRPAFFDWDAPLSAGDLANRWGPIVPVGLLPNVENPPSGYIQACGNPPWSIATGSGMAAEDWPGWLVNDVDTFRAGRARRLLDIGARSFEDCQAMLFDVLVPAALVTVPKLLESIDNRPDWVMTAHPDLLSAVETVRNWNYVAEPSAAGMTFFHVWWRAFLALTDRPWTADELAEAFREYPPELEGAVLEAADRATRLIRTEFESVYVPWGEAHRLRRGDLDIAMPGAVSGQPLFVASDEAFGDGVWPVTYGYGFAMVVEFGQTLRAASLVPFGASDNAGSPHFADQLRLLESRRLKPALFLEDDVLRQSQTAFGRVIRLRPAEMQGGMVLRAPVPVEARSATSTESPAPLAGDTVPFSVFVTVSQTPASLRSDVEIQFGVPEEVCPAKYLGQLVVCSYDDTTGWAALEAQRPDPENHAVLARDQGPRTYAVLGPVRLRAMLGTPELSVPEKTTADLLGPAAPPGTPIVPGAPEPEVEPQEPTESTPEPTELPDLPELDEIPVTPAQPARRLSVVAWGQDLELRPPGVDGEVRIRASSAVGVRVLASPEAPGLLPDGLVAFTEFVTVECSSHGDLKELEITLRLPLGVCAEGNLSSLALYVFNPEDGWTRLPGQGTNPETRRFSGTDTSARAYAVLGPEEFRVFSPGL